MKHNSSCKIVLENGSGHVIRSYNWDEPQLHLIKRGDTGRVEAHGDLDSLDAQSVPYAVLKTVNTSDVRPSGVKVPQVGVLRKIDDEESLVFTSDPELQPEDDNDFLVTLKWSAVAHIGLLLLMLLGYWIHNAFIKEEPVVVQVVPQKSRPIVPKKVVKASRKKIDRRKKVGTKTKKVQKTATKKAKSFGALAVLGGGPAGKKGRTGLNLNSKLNGSGAGNSSGLKSLGKDTSAMAGKGLFSRSGGGGKVDHGTVGYGTKGRAGGQAGYGSLNIGGAAGGYDHIISNGGSVSGGLEKSQIEAVINRNRGQIIYCYEKGLQSQPSLAGRLKAHWIIAGNGSVRSAQKRSSSLRSASVESCILKKIKGWKFPKPHGNVDVKVTYPFNLKRAQLK